MKKGQELSEDAIKVDSRNKKVNSAMLTPEGEAVQGFGSSLFEADDFITEANDTFIACCVGVGCGTGGSDISKHK